MPSSRARLEGRRSTLLASHVPDHAAMFFARGIGPVAAHLVGFYGHKEGFGVSLPLECARPALAVGGAIASPVRSTPRPCDAGHSYSSFCLWIKASSNRSLVSRG